MNEHTMLVTWYSLHLFTEGWPGWVDVVAGYILAMVYSPSMVTHPSTNRARRRAISLIETNALPPPWLPTWCHGDLITQKMRWITSELRRDLLSGEGIEMTGSWWQNEVTLEAGISRRHLFITVYWVTLVVIHHLYTHTHTHNYAFIVWALILQYYNINIFFSLLPYWWITIKETV